MFPSLRQISALSAVLGLLLLAGCDEQPMHQAYSAHFGGEEKVLVRHSDEGLPPDLVASLPEEFRLAHLAGQLTLVLDGPGLVKRPAVKVVDFAVFAHNRDFIEKITELKEQGMVGTAPLGFPHVYALRPAGPISQLFRQGAAQRWRELAETYQALRAEALLLSGQLGRLSLMSRADTLAYLERRLSGAQRPTQYAWGDDPLKGWYEGNLQSIGNLAPDLKNPWVRPEIAKGLKAAQDILTHPEKHFERERARQIRRLRLGVPQVLLASQSLYVQGLGAAKNLDLPAALGMVVDLDLSQGPYSGPEAEFARQALLDALDQTGLIAPMPLGATTKNLRFLPQALVPLEQGQENLLYDAQRFEQILRQAMLEFNGLVQTQLGELRQGLAFLSQTERESLEKRFKTDVQVMEKLNQLEAAP